MSCSSEPNFTRLRWHSKLFRLKLYDIIQSAAKKSSHLKFFAVFSATAWNFNMEFDRFVYRYVLHLTAK